MLIQRDRENGYCIKRCEPVIMYRFGGKKICSMLILDCNLRPGIYNILTSGRGGGGRLRIYVMIQCIHRTICCSRRARVHASSPLYGLYFLYMNIKVNVFFYPYNVYPYIFASVHFIVCINVMCTNT